MNRLLRIGLVFIAMLVIGLVMAVGVFVYTADYNRYKGLIEKAVMDATGRQLEIKGDLTITMSLPPELSVADVTLANAPWGSQPQMVHVGELRVRIRLIDTQLLLETDADGQANWQFNQTAGSRTGTSIRSASN